MNIQIQKLFKTILFNQLLTIVESEYDKYFDLYNQLVRTKNSLLNIEGDFEAEPLYEEEKERVKYPSEEDLEYIILRFENIQNE